MKTSIHPQYYQDTKVTCSCGNKFTTGSTKKEISVDICSSCHPFFTGEMRFVDTMGRVEKFQAKQKKAFDLQKTRKQKIKAKKRLVRPETLREMLTSKKN